jgi:murein DD-endopeptidase MepM/ murein hydrolase activator NlpD
LWRPPAEAGAFRNEFPEVPKIRVDLRKQLGESCLTSNSDLSEKRNVTVSSEWFRGGSLIRRLILIPTVVLSLLAVVAVFVWHRQHKIEEEVIREADQAHTEEVAEIAQENVPPVEVKITRGDNFVAALQRSGISAEDANAISFAAQHAFNMRQVRAGNTIVIERTPDGSLHNIDYKIDPDRMLEIVPSDRGFSAEVKPIPSRTEVATVAGEIDGSLFNAVAQAGESPELTLELARIFGYDLDFYTDPRKGDTFRVVIERKKYADGKMAGYGKVLAAEYNNGGRKYQALLFHDDSGRSGYYTAEGKALQKTFLRSPLKFDARVTSHFSKARFHPILKRYRPHMGTDYGAPVGTPVQSIGNGRVVFAGRKGGEGNMIHIAHSSGYETMYLHLSRMYVRNGEHVESGKTIGLVGSTGLSTGPHLDFRILQRGQYINFEKLGLPPSDPVSKKAWPEFALVREHWLPLLENPSAVAASAAAAVQTVVAPSVPASR